MMTVNEVSKLTGVSIRTLQYYDTISFARLEYSSIFVVSNTLKSIYFTPIPFIPRAKLIR